MPSEDLGAAWVLQGFSKVDDLLRTEFPISREQIVRLREVITPDADDPWMFSGYDVPVESWPAVEAILHCGPPDPGLDYQTGCYAAD
ncbi:DUF7683 domain-containing protein [Streptomyces roseolus]